MTRATDLVCCDDRERRTLTRKAPLNGLDYVEVSDDGLELTVYFLGEAPSNLAAGNVRIDGGQRIRNIRVTHVDLYKAQDSDHDGRMVVAVDQAGDFSTYTLSVVALDSTGRPTDTPPADFDPRYAQLDFTFEAGSVSELDCKPEALCAPVEREHPDINYLAKDYASFRQLMMDRLALVMPDWTERHVPDLGVTLIEMLAYAGDHLSYYQDAVATEAYLDTARLRISVRRHARLVDYVMHEGCNARAWVVLSVSEKSLPLDTTDVYFVTTVDNTASTVLDGQDLPRTSAAPYLVFEPMVAEDCEHAGSGETEISLHSDHNEIHLYTWHGKQCCLPKGAVSATLVDPGQVPRPDPKHETYGEYDRPAGVPSEPASSCKPDEPDDQKPKYLLDLKRCDVLIFEEVKGPNTDNAADADPSHRHAVRLTRVTQGIDPVPDGDGNLTLVVEVEWGDEDALPFPLCISSVGPAPECAIIENVSVARGNVLLVDHGGRLCEDIEQRVPTIDVPPECCDECTPREVRKLPGPYAPHLPKPDITFAEPLPPCCLPALGCGESTRVTPAAKLLRQDPRKALPMVSLEGFPAAPNGKPAFAVSNLENPETLARQMAAAKQTQSGDESRPAAWLRGHLTMVVRDALDSWAAQKPPVDLPATLRDELLRLLRVLRQAWKPQLDLLASNASDPHFAVEMDDERRAHLRFGNGESGRRPDAGTSFRACYRTGNGVAGNVGSESITQMVVRTGPKGGVTGCRNPMPAAGGTAPELVAEAKLLAPYQFRHRLERAITAADYASIVMRDFALRVQRAAAVMSWNGIGAEVVVAIDARGRTEADSLLLCEIDRHLQRYRRIGHDVRVVSARTVPLDIELLVNVRAGYLKGHVEAALLDLFSNRALPDGRRGYFHPDKLTFGQGIYVSRLTAAAQATTGVESVELTRLERMGEGPTGEIESGVLPLGEVEVARLDNDPNFPERGHLTLKMEGGR